MGLEQLLDHTCDIYHIVKEGKSIGYGLPLAPSFSYGNAPDESQVRCHFSAKTDGITIVQQEPMNEMKVRMKLTLPTGTEIKLNDKVVDCTTGIEYIAEIPRNIRGHHLVVYIKAERNL